jgi:drug/metabolite transporter (DMT)-like permease
MKERLKIIVVAFALLMVLNLTVFARLKLKDKVEAGLYITASLGMGISLIVYDYFNGENASSSYIKYTAVILCLLSALFSVLYYKNVNYKKSRMLSSILALLVVVVYIFTAGLFTQNPSVDE